MTSLDAGVKYHGMSLEGRVLLALARPVQQALTLVASRASTTPGYQLQTSAMAIKDVLQL
jgi:hypothetical protein